MEDFDIISRSSSYMSFKSDFSTTTTTTTALITATDQPSINLFSYVNKYAIWFVYIILNPENLFRIAILVKVVIVFLISLKKKTLLLLTN